MDYKNKIIKLDHLFDLPYHEKRQALKKMLFEDELKLRPKDIEKIVKIADKMDIGEIDFKNPNHMDIILDIVVVLLDKREIISLFTKDFVKDIERILNKAHSGESLTEEESEAIVLIADAMPQEYKEEFSEGMTVPTIICDAILDFFAVLENNIYKLKTKSAGTGLLITLSLMAESLYAQENNCKKHENIISQIINGVNQCDKVKECTVDDVKNAISILTSFFIQHNAELSNRQLRLAFIEYLKNNINTNNAEENDILNDNEAMKNLMK